MTATAKMTNRLCGLSDSRRRRRTTPGKTRTRTRRTPVSRLAMFSHRQDRPDRFRVVPDTAGQDIKSVAVPATRQPILCTRSPGAANQRRRGGSARPTSMCRHQTSGRHLCRERSCSEKNLVTCTRRCRKPGSPNSTAKWWLRALHAVVRPGRGAHGAVDPKGPRHRHTVVERLPEVARGVAAGQLFVLTFETEFFGRHGFTERSRHPGHRRGVRGDVPVL